MKCKNTGENHKKTYKNRRVITLISIIVIVIAVTFIIKISKPIPNNYDIKTYSLAEVKQQYSQSNSIKKTKKIAIAFGGGGVRGFMHIGVMKAFEEAGIKANIVTGTSVGSFAASMYASGKSFKEISEVVLGLGKLQLADIVVSREGLLNGQAIAKWINEKTNNQLLEDKTIPIGIAVTNLNNGESLLITKGNTGNAVQASSSIPGTFMPVYSNKQILVDGGITTIVPIRFARAMGADFVIAVDIYCSGFQKIDGSAINTLLAAFRLQGCRLSKEEIAEADFIISPVFEPKNYRDFSFREEAIEVAYKTTKKLIPELKKLILEYRN